MRETVLAVLGARSSDSMNASACLWYGRSAATLSAGGFGASTGHTCCVRRSSSSHEILAPLAALRAAPALALALLAVPLPAAAAALLALGAEAEAEVAVAARWAAARDAAFRRERQRSSACLAWQCCAHCLHSFCGRSQTKQKPAQSEGSGGGNGGRRRGAVGGGGLAVAVGGDACSRSPRVGVGAPVQNTWWERLGRRQPGARRRHYTGSSRRR